MTHPTCSNLADTSSNECDSDDLPAEPAQRLKCSRPGKVRRCSCYKLSRSSLSRSTSSCRQHKGLQESRTLVGLRPAWFVLEVMTGVFVENAAQMAQRDEDAKALQTETATA
eukprot:839748-Amphidinium_carterae.1